MSERKEPWEELPPPIQRPREGQGWLQATLQGQGRAEAPSTNGSLREGVPGTFLGPDVGVLFSSLKQGPCLPRSPVHPHPQTRVQNTLAGTHPPTAHCNHIHIRSFDPVRSWCIPLPGPHSPCLRLSSGAARHLRLGGGLPPSQPLPPCKVQGAVGPLYPHSHCPQPPPY